MTHIDDKELDNVNGGAGAARPLGKPAPLRPISQETLFNALMDPIQNVGPMMRNHPGLPVKQQTLDAVRNMGAPTPVR
jgi:hypothetical protein